MKKHLIYIILAAAVFGWNISFAYLQSGQKNQTPQEIPQRIIVKFKSGFSNQIQTAKGAANKASLDELNQKFSVKKLVPLDENASNKSKIFDELFLVKSDKMANLEAMAAEYASLPFVEYAEPDYMLELYDTPPTDVLYPQQWNLNNTSQWHYIIEEHPGDNNDKLVISYGGTYDADIDAEEVYASPPDNVKTTIVAILDSGADMDHADLAGSIWINPYEIPGNGIDDDHNGYTDDIHGWDFAGSDDILLVDFEDNDPTDEMGHGTHCAGIIAGLINNIDPITGRGIGIAGVTNNCRIMPLKFLPWSLVSKAAKALIYAADNGADVVSMSFGYPFQSYLLEEALQYAKSKGVVLIASSGNSGKIEYNYPSASLSTISVGAMNDSNHVTDYSTYGNFLNVIAPGEDILSLRANNTDMYAENKEPNVHIFGNNYYFASGTSMAAPHVAAIAAFIRSVSVGLRPDSVQKIIQNSCQDLVDPYGRGANLPGWDKYSGYGVVSLYDSYQNTTPFYMSFDSPRNFQIVSNTIAIIGSVLLPSGYSYIIEYGYGSKPVSWNQIAASNVSAFTSTLASWVTNELADGLYSVRLRSASSTNIITKQVFVANHAHASINYPATLDTVINLTSIDVAAYAPGFDYFILDYSYYLVPEYYTELSRSNLPAENGFLTDWIVEDLPEGIYNLRLRVFAGGMVANEQEIPVYVRSTFSSDFAWKYYLGSPVSVVSNYGDFDNDGKSEIIVGSTTGLVVFNTDGTIKTDGLPVFPTNGFLAPVAVGDLDGDKIDDIVAMGYNPPKLYGFPSNGFPFETNLYYSNDYLGGYQELEHDFAKIFLKDIDHNGLDEIHIVFTGQDSIGAQIYNSQGGLIFDLPYASELLSVDLDGSGTDEIYAYLESDSSLASFDINGNMTGNIANTIGAVKFRCLGLSAYDIDHDDLPELIAYGYYDGFGYYLYAYNSNFEPVSGWSRSLGVREYVVPTSPIFSDIDGDGEFEYITTYFDLSVSYILIWNANGTSFIAGNPNGLFATIPNPGILNMIMVADIDGDEQMDILANANNDVFSTYRVQRLYAWNLDAEIIDGFPLIINTKEPVTYFDEFRFTPTVSDMNQDGFVDLAIPTSDKSLAFINFPTSPFHFDSSAITSWRYNRRLNNIAVDFAYNPLDVEENDNTFIPKDFALRQNYPNPFNPATVIEFSLPARSEVDISIYNILGRKVKTLLSSNLSAGNHHVQWDGTNEDGTTISTGIYFYKITAGSYSDTKKMVLLK
ncbi:MAG: S8 family serine peptidase [Candidatus Zixiibacteriota bacterium]